MKSITYEEFYKSLLFKNREIFIPILGISIDKNQFVTNKGYNTEKQDIFLKEIYNSNLIK